MSQQIIPELQVTKENVWKWAQDFARNDLTYKRAHDVIRAVLGKWCFISHREQDSNDLAEIIWEDYMGHVPRRKPVNHMTKDELLHELFEETGAAQDVETMEDLLDLPWFKEIIEEP